MTDSQAPAACVTITLPLSLTREEADRRYVLAVYATLGRNKAATVRQLDVSEKTLYNLLNRWVDAGLVTREEAGLR